jgi:hypothetical protein
MGKIRNPIQFSEHFGISETLLDKLGVLDPTLNVDVKLFVDPLLLEGSKHAEIRKSAKSFRNYFVEIIKLLVASKREGDVAWREAQRRLQFSEVPGTCLGYSAASIRGSACRLLKKLLIWGLLILICLLRSHCLKKVWGQI